MRCQVKSVMSSVELSDDVVLNVRSMDCYNQGLVGIFHHGQGGEDLNILFSAGVRSRYIKETLIEVVHIGHIF